MKMPSLNDENDNLVLFPSAKNFKAEEELSDPMIDLLNEYSHMLDRDIPEHLDERFEDFYQESHQEFHEESHEEEVIVYGSLEAFMARNQNQDQCGLTSDNKFVKSINERIRAIAELKERIKFYLDEIEMFLPSRRR